MVDPVAPMAGQIIISDTAEAAAARMAEDFAALVQKVLSNQDRFTVALSGGATPKLLFTRLAQEPYRSHIPWDKVWCFWGDERCVPPDHPESNYGMARQFLLEKVPIKSAHVFRIRGEDPPPETARAYARTMHDVFKDVQWPAIDLIMLGIGPDGHTASLMPGTAALHEERRWVVENVVRSLQTVRITIVLPVINQGKNVWFLITGPKKAGPFARAQQGPDEACPASLVHPENGELRWYVDKAVATP
jgi:6-phosphogluconolactonase